MSLDVVEVVCEVSDESVVLTLVLLELVEVFELVLLTVVPTVLSVALSLLLVVDWVSTVIDVLANVCSSEVAPDVTELDVPVSTIELVLVSMVPLAAGSSVESPPQPIHHPTARHQTHAFCRDRMASSIS